MRTMMRVSPPTRGWTRRDAGASAGRGGFPAHAGMDPSRRCSGRRRKRFPRPRGDGPPESCQPVRLARVSPPTRGWTRPDNSNRHRGQGFPAHAGMDPRSHHAPYASRRFPRPRGDGPSLLEGTVRRLVVSPPTRGWTVIMHTPVGLADGFPAHAGMDPIWPWLVLAVARFPPPRGDGPCWTGIVCMAWRVSPPTRGWTLGRAFDRFAYPGFPAHAGMDPRRRTGRRGSRGFPRPRGDGPLQWDYDDWWPIAIAMDRLLTEAGWLTRR